MLLGWAFSGSSRPKSPECCRSVPLTCRIALNAHEYLNICTSNRVAHKPTTQCEISFFSSTKNSWNTKKSFSCLCRLFFRQFSWAYFPSALMQPQWEQAMNDVQMCSCLGTTIFHLTVSVKLYTTRTCVVQNLRSRPFKSRSLSTRAMCTRSRLYMIITWLCGEKKEELWMCEWRNQFAASFSKRIDERPSVNE